MVMLVMVGYCNDGWIVVLAAVSVAVCGGMCVVGIGGGVNDGCCGSLQAHHHHQPQKHHHNNHHLHQHLPNHLKHTAYTIPLLQLLKLSPLQRQSPPPSPLQHHNHHQYPTTTTTNTTTTPPPPLAPPPPHKENLQLS